MEPKEIKKESETEIMNTQQKCSEVNAFLEAELSSLASNRVKLESETSLTQELEETEENLNYLFDGVLPNDEEREPKQQERSKKRVKQERVDLEEGEVDDGEDTSENHRDRTKHKKSKRSKRNKSTESPQKIKTEKTDSPSSSSNAGANENNRPRLQIRAEFRSFRVPTPPPPQEEPVASPEQPQTQIETHIGHSRNYQPIAFQLTTQDEPEEQKPQKELTSEEKLCKGLERVMYARKAFQKAKTQKEKKFYVNDPVFAYTSTVRKLPTSFSYFTQQIYDNRSPLHTVNNVTFQFNSMATRLNLQEWGLESLPPKSTAVARILGYDVDKLFAKKQCIKIPDKIQKSDQTASDPKEKENSEQSKSSLYMNVMVQTEEVKVIPIRRRDFYRDVGLQFTPPTNVIGTQTNPLYTGEGAELPLFKVIRQLNENQLEAVDEFVQLILEPSGNSSIDLYQQRKRLTDIFKMSQIPAEDSTLRKRSAHDAGFSERIPSPPPPPSIYANRDFIKTEPRGSSFYNQPAHRRRPQPPIRHGAHTQSAPHYVDISDDEPTPSVKFYGRGGMRR